MKIYGYNLEEILGMLEIAGTIFIVFYIAFVFGYQYGFYQGQQINDIDIDNGVSADPSKISGVSSTETAGSGIPTGLHLVGFFGGGILCLGFLYDLYIRYIQSKTNHKKRIKK